MEVERWNWNTCTNHIPHVVNNINPSSFNHSLFVTVSNCEFLVVNFHEIQNKMNEMLSQLGRHLLVVKLACWCWEMEIETWNRYMCTNHIPHMVNSTGPSSLNHSCVVSSFQLWNSLQSECPWNLLKKKWNVEWIGSIFPCSETSFYYTMDIERWNWYMCSNHVPHSVNNTGHSSFTCSHFQLWIHCSEIHHKMSEMLSELGPVCLWSETGLLVLRDGDWKMESV